MTTHDVASALVKFCTEGKFDQAIETLYSANIVSVEAGAPPGQSREAKGLAAVKAKSEFWIANHDIHSFLVEGPLVAGSHFAVVFKIDATFKPQSETIPTGRDRSLQSGRRQDRVRRILLQHVGDCSADVATRDRFLTVAAQPRSRLGKHVLIEKMSAERDRLLEDRNRTKYWKRWGPYLSERSWGNPREDYSADGDAWEYFTHDHARSRAYRWTEDGIAGISDNHQRLCFAFAFWNGADPILKERLFGLSGPEGNHGEDVKEYYYYLDSTPTHSYMKCLYKYPQLEFPYSQLVTVNRGRSRSASEYELMETGIFDEDRYFDIFIEYAKNDVEDILVRATIINRGPSPATLHLLPTVWFRNTWSWGYEGRLRPELLRFDTHTIAIQEQSLGQFKLWLQDAPPLLFTQNESNTLRLWGYKDGPKYSKDAFHRYLIKSEKNAVNPDETGTKACGVYRIELDSCASKVLHFRLYSGDSPQPDFHQVFLDRIMEAEDYYSFAPASLSDDARMCSARPSRA